MPMIFHKEKYRYLLYEKIIKKIKEKKQRILKLEKIILNSPYYAYKYARDIIKGKWPEAEKIISTEAYTAYNYAICILNNNFKDGENVIAEKADYAYYYAYKIIKGPWEDGEEIISKSAEYSVLYSQNILKKPFYKSHYTLFLKEENRPFKDLYVKKLKKLGYTEKEFMEYLI